MKVFVLLMIVVYAAGCIKIDHFEKTSKIPSREWYYDNKPQFSFDVSDTSLSYNIYITLRHTDGYKYNNIWLRLGSKFPGDSMRFQNINLVLASDAKGWEGTGLNDIYEARKLISRGPVAFARPGEYTFSVEQIMRENPLQNILNVGIRIEKAGIQP